LVSLILTGPTLPESAGQSKHLCGPIHFFPRARPLLFPQKVWQPANRGTREENKDNQPWNGIRPDEPQIGREIRAGPTHYDQKTCRSKGARELCNRAPPIA
jgi:hypothetical protein